MKFFFRPGRDGSTKAPGQGSATSRTIKRPTSIVEALRIATSIHPMLTLDARSEIVFTSRTPGLHIYEAKLRTLCPPLSAVFRRCQQLYMHETKVVKLWNNLRVVLTGLASKSFITFMRLFSVSAIPEYYRVKSGGSPVLQRVLSLYLL
jgi:hypothetical protein